VSPININWRKSRDHLAKHSVVNNCRCQTMVHKRRNVEFGRDQS